MPRTQKYSGSKDFPQDNSFIYVTTQFLTTELLDGIAADVDEFEHLLICAPAFDTGLNKRYENITVRKSSSVGPE